MGNFLRTLNTPSARSTAVYYLGNFTLNIGRYFFHLILLRFLVPAEYGEFLSYLSLMYLLSIPTGTIASVVTKFVSEFKGKNDRTRINLFFYYLIRVLSPITFGLGLLFIVFANNLALIFKAHPAAFVILGISTFASLYQTVIQSYLAAFQRFIFQTMVGFIGIISTILLSILFINLGLGATGPVIGQLMAGIITSAIILYSIRTSVYPKLKISKPPSFSLTSFTGYSFVYTLGTMSLMSTDVLLIRAFFDPHLSGLYSSLSILGRMIIFGLSPLIALVLPVASHRYAANGSARSIFLKLGLVILLFGMIGAGLFAIFPNLIITILSGPAYLSAAPFLGIFAFSMVFFALTQFITSYFLATGRPKASLLLLIATAAQPLAYFFFRHSFTAIIWSNFVIQLLLTLSLILYGLIFTETKNKK
jgi:O-antigen/teichoic acid export membrane protein